MNISKFFIDRPIFAGVLSVLVLLAGLLAMFQLPISEYPEVVPPSVVVRAQYPGANPKVIAETVASPLEESINGVENMLYMQSQANSDGNLTLTVNFKLGVDPDKAQQLVQNRVSQALPRLPPDVQRLGVTTAKSSPTLTLVVHLISPNDRYDITYLRNYAILNVKDRLARITGVGEVTVWGSGNYSMRVWLDPQKVAQRGMTAGEVVSAIREQNVQVAAGVIGASPTLGDVPLQLNVNARGRLQTEEEFRDIILKTSPDGAVTHLSDVARVELDAQEYGLRSLLDNKQAVGMGIMQSPGANALDVSTKVRAAMAELAQDFPGRGVPHRVRPHPVRQRQYRGGGSYAAGSDRAGGPGGDLVPADLARVHHPAAGRAGLHRGHLRAAPGLRLFHQRAVAVRHGAGHRHRGGRRHRGGGKRRAQHRRRAHPARGDLPRHAGSERPHHRHRADAVRGVRAAGLHDRPDRAVLQAVRHDHRHLDGDLGLQLADPVAGAVGHPAQGPSREARLADPWHEPRLRPLLQLVQQHVRPRLESYGVGVSGVIRRKAGAMGVYALLVAATIGVSYLVPGGFVPAQDKQYLIGFTQLPNGASLDRTDAVIRRMSDIALKEPGVQSAIAFPGLSINGFTNSSSAGIVFVMLKPFNERKGAALSGNAIAGSLNQKFAAIQDAFIAVFPPPPVMGLGTLGGFKFQIEDRGAAGYAELDKAKAAFLAKARQAPELGPAFSSYEINVPQLDVDLDRVKAKQLGVPVTEVFDTMQIYLGSMYVNDFNRFGRVFQVRAQADAPFRAHADDILQLKTRNSAGDMVPLSSLVTVKQTFGPEMVVRYNGYTAADINGGPAPGYSSDQAQAAAERVAAETLPRGMKLEWTDLTYQQILAGNAGLWVFPISVLLVFLVLAALYESLTLPLAVIMIVPMSILAALTGVYLTGADNNIFTQIGLMVLVGLSAKNAILIVEFARELEMNGRSPLEAAIEASRLRLRPILMTSIAFIMGVVPLVLSSGAGSEMRHAMGVAVFFGMLGVTLFGLFLTPVFYVLLRSIGGKKLHSAAPHEAPVCVPHIDPHAPPASQHGA